jgi:hypothetical protein
MSGPSPQDDLALFSIAGFPIPVVEYEVVGALRDFVHEYSHQDGGDPEKLGRKLYVIRATLNFQAKFARYPGLWPDRLNQLTTLFETGATFDLLVPSIGTIQAYAVGWTRKWTAKVRSGEMVTVEFREDATNLPLPITVSGPSPQSMVTAASLAAVNAAQAAIPRDPIDGQSRAASFRDRFVVSASDMSLIASLQSLVSSLQGIEDSADLAGNQVLLQCQQIMSLCGQIDQLGSVQSASNAELMRNIHDVWIQAQSYANDLQQQNAILQQWITPTVMSMGAVSVAIFGDTTHVTDLLSLNTGGFYDPLLIPAGTLIVYYPTTNGGG